MDAIFTEETFPVSYTPITTYDLAVKCRKWVRDRRKAAKMAKGMCDLDLALKRWNTAKDRGLDIRKVSDGIPPHIVSDGRVTLLKIT